MNKFSTIECSYFNFSGNNIFYRYKRGTSDIFISFLHGYPTSSLDYSHLMERIPKEYHVVAHDHLGFGLSDKPIQHNYLLNDQADIVLGLYKSLGASRVHVVAHDYGTSVATEIVARHNKNEIDFEILSVTLCNGSMLIDMAKLRMIQRLLKHKWIGSLVAKLSSEYTFQSNMKNIWFDKNLYSKEEMKKHWDLLIGKEGKKVLPKITQYIDQRHEKYDRWIGGLEQSRLPFHILWAENDPVAVVDMAYRLDTIIDNSTLTIIKECGHYPMIEKGDIWLRYIIWFVDNLGQEKNYS